MIDPMRKIVQRALEEDIGTGDVTTDAIVPPEATVGGRFIAKSPGVVAGWEAVRVTFALLDGRVEITPAAPDGARVESGQVIAAISGPGRATLAGERVALNFLQRMSGIATLTRRFVEVVAGTGAVILDTRKTVPGLRLLDKMAVKIGGGENHRFGLYDMVLIKDNHIAAAGGIGAAVARVRACVPQDLKIEVEVKNVDELENVLALNVDRILLDNMSLEGMQRAVRLVNRRVPLEASGNIGLDNVGAVAATGVDYISVGALTHSVRAMDISMKLDM
jgi:nicotinate-nucleotide pyrophosphorylase (carboxylating)